MGNHDFMVRNDITNSMKEKKERISIGLFIFSIIILILGIIGSGTAWKIKKMRSGVALLYENGKMIHLYQYYPILFLISLALFISGCTYLLRLLRKAKIIKDLNDQGENAEQLAVDVNTLVKDKPSVTHEQ